jgi:hypothetical protein
LKSAFEVVFDFEASVLEQFEQRVGCDLPFFALVLQLGLDARVNVFDHVEDLLLRFLSDLTNQHELATLLYLFLDYHHLLKFVDLVVDLLT